MSRWWCRCSRGLALIVSNPGGWLVGLVMLVGAAIGGIGLRLLIAVTGVLIGMKVRYTPFILGAMCVVAWFYFPLSATHVDAHDDSPVPYREAIKMTFIACTAFANLGGLVALFWLRHTA